MSGLGELVGAAIVEKDANDDTLMTWCFPSIEPEMEKVILSRCILPKQADGVQTHFSKHKGVWQYYFACPATTQQHRNLDQLVSLSVCILGKAYEPEKFIALAKILAATYVATGSAAKVMEAYLAVFTTGKCEAQVQGVKPFKSDDFDPRRALLGGSLKAVIKGFKTHSILLWVAVVLKRRIVVYGNTVSDVNAVVRALPLLAWHRQDWGVLTPYCTLNPLEMETLKKEFVYIAGFTDPAIKSREDFYDIIVDITSRSITVSSGSSDKFVLGSFHKEMASFLTSSCDDPDVDDQGLVKGVSTKTKELIGNTKGLCGKEGVLTQDDMDAKKIPANMRPFLFELAMVEGIAKLGQ